MTVKPLKEREMTEGQYETILTLCTQAMVSDAELESIIKIYDDTKDIIDLKSKNLKLTHAGLVCNYLKLKVNSILRNEKKKTMSYQSPGDSFMSNHFAG